MDSYIAYLRQKEERLPVHFVVHRKGFTITDGLDASSAVQVERPVVGQSRLVFFVASLASVPHRAQGATTGEILRCAPFSHLRRKEANFIRVAQRYVSQLEAALGTWSQLLRIEENIGLKSKSFRVVLTGDSTISVAKELEDLLARERDDAVRVSWLTMPPHDLAQLRTFVHAIALAAKFFDKGNLPATIGQLTKALDEIEEPHYAAVLRFRLARVYLRNGDEETALKEIDTASELIEQRMSPVDDILVARVHYNRAWIGYTRGNFGYDLIQRAQESLANAGPDDIRHGYVATQHGLVILKDLERRQQELSNEELLILAREGLAYLAHAVYLLTRSEDFWGVQESCWNLAYGLFSIGQLPSCAAAQLVGTRARNIENVKDWLAVSDSTAQGHGTGKDSMRNLILKASVAMASGKLADAGKHLLAVQRNIAKIKSPRELGRLYERLAHYYILRGEKSAKGRRNNERLALTMYEKAEDAWGKFDLEKLITNELGEKYVYRQDHKRLERRIKRANFQQD